MLTPEYLEEVSNVLLPMYEALHETIIEDVVRRIAKTGIITESAEHQLKVVQQSGLAYQDTLEKIGAITGIVNCELEEVFEDAALNTIEAENDIGIEAGVKPINLKQSETMSRILKAELTKTQKEIHNLTLTTANTAQIAYFNASNMAYLKVTSGAFSYTEAIRQAIKDVVQQCDVITYPSGHKDKIDVAIRRAVLTGVNQTSAKLSEAYCEETECDYVETTAHSGARPDHASWQGKVFCRSGKDKKYPPFSQTGYGTGAGLCGWNCRHSFHAFFPGISAQAYTKEMLADYDAKKYEYEGKKLTDYECSQIQRSMERDIRGKKRELAGINSAILNTDIKHVKESLKKDFQKESVALKSKEATLKDFCRKTKRRVEGNRVQVTATRDRDGRVIGFGKSVSQKAVHSAKSYHKEWIKSIGAEKDGPKTLAEYYDLKYSSSKEKRLFDGYVSAVNKGRISPLVGYDEFLEYDREITNELDGLKFKNGNEIKGHTAHFVDRIIGTHEDITKTDNKELNKRMNHKSVTIDDAKDAILNGELEDVKVDRNGRKSQRIIGEKCVVTYNPDTGELIQTNRR